MAEDREVAESVRLNGKYLQEAESPLAKGDLPQASEELWGATAEIIKAVAAKGGVRLGTHRGLAEFVTTLNRERPEWQLIDAFNYANSLHTNFYENHPPEEHVRHGAEIVRDLVARLKQML